MGKTLDSINLCMMAPEFFPVWGGTGSYTVELLKFLPKNVNVHVITLRRTISDMSKKGSTNVSIKSLIGRSLEVHYLSSSRETFFYNLPFQLACLKQIPSLHKRYKFDIMHSHLSHMPDVFLKLFNKVRVPTVVTAHSTIRMQKDATFNACPSLDELEWSELNTLLFYPAISFLQKNYVKRVSRFIAVSNTTRKMLKEHLNVDEEKIDLVYNGVDTKLFHPPTKDELEKRYSKPTVVYVGRVMSKKGISVLIRAMPQIFRSFSSVKFLFVGGGNIPMYKKIIKNRGIPENNVSFVGHLGYFERLKILREATVFVNPSFFENCSMSILEAMSSGAAVVASDVGGNPEIIESEKNGLLVPASDHVKLGKSIMSLLENENLNKEICREARKTAETSFSSGRCASETYNIYKKMLANAP